MPRHPITNPAFVIATLILGILITPTMSAFIPECPATYSRFDGAIDPFLQKMMKEQDGEETFRSLVQFRSWPIEVDIVYAQSIGLKHIATMKALPAVLLEGTSEGFERLSGYPRTYWMEYDGELELLMEESLSTINATIAWNSFIRSTRDRYPEITGEGVTVAVVDTGIDAGHPDLDYGEKTIINLKQDKPGRPFYEIENSDTSYGHGTHCAGTIAGNGDASAGARAGVAPGSKLIGLCVGDVGITLTNTYEGLEWVYLNSKKPNQMNIKVVSNSWGGGAAEYDPQDATSQICQKLTYENNVVVVFAMGNAGSGYHEGQELTASPTGLIPSNIGVAAFQRDGSGIAYFSSRGMKGLNQTYPDVGAPGVKIWSAHARLTEISAMSKIAGNPNPYYLAISGTSMATPHVSGLAALIFQAAPSLTISDRWEDYSGPDKEWWYGNEYNRIHEVEWIMEQSATYLEPDGIPLSNEQEDNGVPEASDRGETEIGWDGRRIDWAQGYGLVNAEKAVGIALTLQELRTRYPHDKWTVKDAIGIYNGREVFGQGARELSTDILETEWSAEFARYAQDGDSPILVQNQSRLVWVPESAQEITINLNFNPIDVVDRTMGELTFIVDHGFDGEVDYQEPFLRTMTLGSKTHTFTELEGKTNMYWAIGVYGRGFKLIRPVQDGEYMELRIEYTIGVSMKVAIPETGILEVFPPTPNSMVSRWEGGIPSQGYPGGVVSIMGTVYDLDRVLPFEEDTHGDEDKGSPWPFIFGLLIVAAALTGGWVLYKKKRRGV
ncbi:MAG: S8 family serine peptidase [Candidatus Thermoplasmatota archaeon]|nr:S8 family serine peptidase [Candidatus Thermoplasmatota archaeon]